MNDSHSSKPSLPTQETTNTPEQATSSTTTTWSPSRELRPDGTGRLVVITVVEIAADLAVKRSYWTATTRQHSVEFTGPHPTPAAAWATSSAQHAA